MKLKSFVLGALFLLAGCEKETTLHSGLEEQQANLVMAALLDDGIACHKTRGEEGTWNVMVDESKFAAAVNLLERKGLPRRAHQGIGEVFKKTGMISSPSEERIRFMDALAQDIARTISMIDGVVDARVHVVLPENDIETTLRPLSLTRSGGTLTFTYEKEENDTMSYTIRPVLLVATDKADGTEKVVLKCE